MWGSFMKLRLLLLVVSCLYIQLADAAKPLFKLEVVTQAPNELREGETAIATYRLGNNTPLTQTVGMVSTEGVSLISTVENACPFPAAVLGPGQSCLLYTLITASSLKSRALLEGPRACLAEGSNHQTYSPFACSDPSPQDTFNLRVLPQVAPKNTWIKVLIQQSPPPAAPNLVPYLNKVKALAPNLEQFHVRFLAGDTNYAFYAEVIQFLQGLYDNKLSIGFHPDNSSSSYTLWGCTSPDWKCVFNASIKAMNSVNALLPQGVPGFAIFSLEQSYVEPDDPDSLTEQKACLNPNVSSGTCPVATIASPVVKFGNVLPSFGSSDIYGSDKLDYGYPQMYNLGKRLVASNSGLVENGYFPVDSAKNCINSAPYPYNVVDVDNQNAYPQPKIPCSNNPPNIYNTANPLLAASYMGYLLTQYPPIAVDIPTNGATVYMTLSGEPDFLGAPGWTFDKLQSFYDKLSNNFTFLQANYPDLFPPGGASPDTLQYAIWNIDAIIANN